MNAHPLLQILRELPEYNRLQELTTGAQGPAAAFGLPEAHRAHVFAALVEGRSGLFLTASEQSAERVYAMVRAFSPHAALLPPRELPLVNAYAASVEGAKTRISTLTRLALGEPLAVIASVNAILQRLAPPGVLQNTVYTLKPGDCYPPRSLLQALCDAGYERVDLVEGPGQAALRGDILDAYPPHAAQPCRIEFFDDEVDRLSVFDPATQRSEGRLEQVMLSPATEAPQDANAIARALRAIKNAAGFDAQRTAFEEGRACPGAETLLPVLYERAHTLFDYLPKDALFFLEEPHRLEEAAESAERLFQASVAAMLERGEGLSAQAELQMPVSELFMHLRNPRACLLFTLSRSFARIRALESVQFDARTAPRYTGDLTELARDIGFARHTNGRTLLYAGAHAERMMQQLLDIDVEAGLAKSLTRMPLPGETLIVEESLEQGFLYPHLQLSVLSEFELFGYTRRPPKKRHSDKPRVLFSELSPGDFIVHEAHGIGRFIGVEALTVQDTTRDYLLMEYAAGDRLYIPTDQLDRVQKYVGGEETPRLSKLGGSEWQRQVTRARGAVKELAFDLAKLYAQRQNSLGFAFSADSPWQKQMEERFAYAETPDQIESLAEIKRDMESTRVMDRLLCGDVGYGKTEVALRAAFKAVQDSKQVALLVPTTILAQQHYNTLSTRFAGFPVRVALLSRFQSAEAQKSTKQALTSGKVDVVVGTHALLAKDVKFHDLGLLIVDEEQRFGVGHKEQLKTLKANVDVLTLTATPIPRTLHMSMVGIRDMSVIDTPPEDRVPVQTYVLEYSDTLLSDAIGKEINRGGQCYIVYNQVRKMERFTEHMRMLMPDARIAHAHGQMPERQLEQVMLDFYEGKYDALLCSTIIENGLDIGNANTMVVLDADKMGLAQLYQLRGRVGRTARLGYAYFTFERNKSLSEIAHKRLRALTEFAQFGAGREIALRDLEIRGAGSLLGANQHGHIADIGYEYYCKLMESAVREARGEEGPSLLVDTTIDMPLDAHIPKSYIRNEVQRLSMYKRIAMISDDAAMMDVQEELEDRYGDIPEATQNLLYISLIKAMCARAHIASLSVRESVCKIVFHEQASLDGGKLLKAAGAFAFQLLPGDTVSLHYRIPDAHAEQLARALLPLLAALQGCL